MASVDDIRAFVKRLSIINTSSSYADDIIENNTENSNENKSDIFAMEVINNKPANPFKSKQGSTIAEDLVIDGSLSSGSAITIHGVVNGNVTSAGSVLIDGKVTGNIKGVSVDISNCEINGDILADVAVMINESGCINGSISASEATINGTVKGNITISENLSIKRSAIVTGDITSKSVSVDAGAVINGRISMTKAEAEY